MKEIKFPQVSINPNYSTDNTVMKLCWSTQPVSGQGFIENMLENKKRKKRTGCEIFV